MDSVGIFSKRLPFTTANTIVKTFRHAISLDERRAKFKANLWNRPTQKEMDDMKGVSGHLPQNTPKHAPTTDAKVDPKSFLKEKFRKRTEEDEEYKELNALERVHSEKREKPTDVEEVWFSVRNRTFLLLLGPSHLVFHLFRDATAVRSRKI